MAERLAHKRNSAKRRAHRVRKMTAGTTERPRLTVFISNVHISAQIIDDSRGQTMAYASTVGDEVAAGNMTEKATEIGRQIAVKAKKVKVKKVVLDRGSRRYHGRIKALAEAARAEGLEF